MSRHRRREHHHDDRGAGERALSRESALPQGNCGRISARSGGSSSPPERGRRSPSPNSPTSRCSKARDAARRERLPGRLRLRRYRRSRRGRLRRGGEEGRRLEGLPETGLRAPVERPVRKHDPRPRAAQDGDSGDAGADLRPASTEHAGARSRRRSSCSPCRSGRSARSGSFTSSATTSSIAAWVGMYRGSWGWMPRRPCSCCCSWISLTTTRKRGLLPEPRELDEAIAHGAVKRVGRPKLMTVAAAFMGLLRSCGPPRPCADVMKRIAPR